MAVEPLFASSGYEDKQECLCQLQRDFLPDLTFLNWLQRINGTNHDCIIQSDSGAT